ncbi:transcriptional regulator [Halonotius terrestris]|uniref:Transcriptional regulator n=1 Tax=Halonotius terrestris TaxID=2487750 RepID=A0A8J8TAZ7_9EURY|nr:helix-turn-helix domain-containing protein [Halonotius terrestris]TQQ79908.1 transcriptional regulator [Halonotius terrestris]
MDDETRTTLQEMPPSAKLVYKTLEYEGPLTQGDLATESLLPSRTVRYALTTLTDEGLIEERLHIQDARKRLYSLPNEESAATTNGDIAVNEPS